MIKGKPYSALGGAFEYLNDDCGYDEWSQYLINKLKSLGAGRVGLFIFSVSDCLKQAWSIVFVWTSFLYQKSASGMDDVQPAFIMHKI